MLALGTGDDAALIARSLHVPECFRVLFDRHAPAIGRYIARRRGLNAADDLVQLRRPSWSPSAGGAVMTWRAATRGRGCMASLPGSSGGTGERRCGSSGLLPVLGSTRPPSPRRPGYRPDSGAAFADAIAGLHQHSTPYHLAHGLLDQAAAAATGEAACIARRLGCQPLLDRAETTGREGRAPRSRDHGACQSTAPASPGRLPAAPIGTGRRHGRAVRDTASPSATCDRHAGACGRADHPGLKRYRDTSTRLLNHAYRTPLCMSVKRGRYGRSGVC